MDIDKKVELLELEAKRLLRFIGEFKKTSPYELASLRRACIDTSKLCSKVSTHNLQRE